MSQPAQPAFSFRLGPNTLAELDRIAEHLTALTGRIHNRTDAVRWAARTAESTLEKTSRKITNRG